jgi:hypothetical protein
VDLVDESVLFSVNPQQNALDSKTNYSITTTFDKDGNLNDSIGVTAYQHLLLDRLCLNFLALFWRNRQKFERQ